MAQAKLFIVGAVRGGSVLCTLWIALRARRLKQPNSMPLGCYCRKKTLLVYVTVNRMASLIREVVKKVRARISAKD